MTKKEIAEKVEKELERIEQRISCEKERTGGNGKRWEREKRITARDCKELHATIHTMWSLGIITKKQWEALIEEYYELYRCLRFGYGIDLD